MAVDFLAPDGTTVIGLSHGYDGALYESDVPAWQRYTGSALGTVRGPADWAVTAVSNQSSPTLQIAAGQGGQDGIMDNTTAPARLTVPVPATTGEVRSYFVVVARTWAGSGGKSTFTLRAATIGNAVPTDAASVLKAPGDASDQVLAVVQVRGGSTGVVSILDRRLTGAKTYRALGARPPVELMPYGAQILTDGDGDTLHVARVDGTTAYTRQVTPGVRQVGGGLVYANLPNSTRRPGGAVKAWADTRRNVAEVIIDLPVPYRVSGSCWGVFGADDNPDSTTTRWDFVIRAGTDGPILGMESPQGFLSDAALRAAAVAQWRHVTAPVSLDVFTGRTVFVLQALRVTGNALGVALTGDFRLQIAAHPTV